jgi:hypothetical protein
VRVEEELKKKNYFHLLLHSFLNGISLTTRLNSNFIIIIIARKKRDVWFYPIEETKNNKN